MEENQKKNHKIKKKYFFIGFALLTVLAMLFFLFAVNRFSLEIVLHGDRQVTLEYGEFYEELGADVSFSGTHILKDGTTPSKAKLEIIGNVNPSVLGRYPITYRTSWLFWKAESVRTVEVVDTQPPVISLNPDSEEALLPGTIYQESGYRALDNYDGDITDRVVITQEEGSLTYAVTDRSGNPASAVRIVPHHDPVPPEIILDGGAEYELPVGIRYKEPGFAAVDNVDGNLTRWVSVEGQPDWLTPGVYPITYTVTDNYLNTTKVTRNVTMKPAERPEVEMPEQKTIYLTFDDGPGPYTTRLLNILDKYDVKATFFVMDTGEYKLMKEIVERGHSIGIHTMTHDYEKIYAGTDAFFEDLYGMQDLIEEHTGVRTTLMRFPGGSSNAISKNYCEGIMTKLTQAVQDAGFQYFDWNVLSGDSGDTTRTKEVYEYVVNAASQLDVALVLQHDIHSYSVAAVEDIILWGLENGYQFLPLQENSPGFHQMLAN